MKEQTAKNINILGRFCGKRDIEALTTDRLQDQYGLKRADVLVLFGGSIISGSDVLAEAIKNGQDATMQRRMDAGLRKYISDDVTVINFAAYKAEVTVKNGQLAYSENIHGMWDMDRDVGYGQVCKFTDGRNPKAYG